MFTSDKSEERYNYRSNIRTLFQNSNTNILEQNIINEIDKIYYNIIVDAVFNIKEFSGYIVLKENEYNNSDINNIIDIVSDEVKSFILSNSGNYTLNNFNDLKLFVVDNQRLLIDKYIIGNTLRFIF